MGRRTKQLVRNRAKRHIARVKSGRKMRARRGSRGQRPASKKRKRAAARRQAKGK